MADTTHAELSNGELIRSTPGRAETTILLWQDIEYHLTDAKRQIERIRRIIEQFELQKR
jgi:ferritin-like metal-binding protein YciE